MSCPRLASYCLLFQVMYGHVCMHEHTPVQSRYQIVTLAWKQALRIGYFEIILLSNGARSRRAWVLTIWPENPEISV